MSPSDRPIPGKQSETVSLLSATQLSIDLDGHRRALVASLERLHESEEDIVAAATLLIDTVRSGGRILTAGNGGSAAQAQHLAGELVGRFLRARSAYDALALNADSAILTALGNDFGYQEVFARQVEAYGRPGDSLVVLSTSGNSENLVRAADTALTSGMHVIGITGAKPNRLAERSTVTIQAPSVETPTIQEVHLVLLHLLAESIECALAEGETPSGAMP